jgi:hypothetical protein
MSAAILSYSDTVLRYFNPSRSPFYAIIAIGVIALDYVNSSTTHVLDVRWITVNAIILVVIVVAVRFSLSHETHMSKSEYMDQLFFARSICVSAAMGSLAWFFDSYNDNWRFYVVLSLSVLQAITFLIYIWANPELPEAVEDTNYVQLGLITTTLMVGACFVLKELPPPAPSRTVLLGVLELNLPAIVLVLLWLRCLRVWWKVIWKLVIFFARRDDVLNEKPRQPANYNSDIGAMPK